MKRVFVIAAVVTVLVASVLFWRSFRFEAPSEFGRFEGSPKVEFVDSGEGKGRTMRLLQDFSYTDPKGGVWQARKGYETDGASIPRVFWSIIGAPFEGSYRNAAIIHDWYCDDKNEPWQDVHRVFYYGSRAAGVDEINAKILYAAVMLGGPKWGKVKSGCFATCHAQSDRMAFDKKGGATYTPDLSAEQAQELVNWIKANNPALSDIDKKAQSHPVAVLE